MFHSLSLIYTLSVVSSLSGLVSANAQQFLESPSSWEGGIFPTTNKTCHWVKFRRNGQQLDMCTHSMGERISNRIARDGYWKDCAILPRLWNDPADPSIGEYIEIGGNIGSCVLEMLTFTDAKVSVFEPNPDNLFCMTSTLERLPSAMRQRITVYPFALGAIPGTNSMYTATNNFGNTVIGKPVHDKPTQQFHVPFPVQIWRYDQVISPKTKVKLLKLDAQGFECNIIRGMGSSVPPLIKTEIAARFLSAQENCSDNIIFKLFHKRNMELFTENNVPLLKPHRTKFDVYDIIARTKATQQSN